MDEKGQPDNNLDAGEFSKEPEVKTEKDDSKKDKGTEKESFMKSLNTKWSEYKGEFRKIIWPSRKELIKKTITVIITSFIFAVIIFGLDTVYNLGVQLFVQLVTK